MGHTCHKEVRELEDSTMVTMSRFAQKLPAYCARWFVLLLPTLLLTIALVRAGQPVNWMLAMGTGFQLVVCLLSFFSNRSWQQPLGPSVITLYLIGLAWLWIGSVTNDWFTHLARAVLLIVPLVVFGLHTLSESGAARMRRANLLAERLAGRKDWPEDLAACRLLPEVRALRAALGYDAPLLWRCSATNGWKFASPPWPPWSFARTGVRARPSWFCKRPRVPMSPPCVRPPSPPSVVSKIAICSK